MKAKSKALLKAENEYLKRILLFTIQVLKGTKMPLESEIMKAATSFTEYHKIFIGGYAMCYNLEKLYDLKDKTIAYEINEEINKR